MDLSIFLAKVFGMYFIIAGVIVIMRRKALMPVIAEFGESRALLLSIGLLELVAGIALLIAHPIFTWDFEGVISLIGAWMIFEGILYAVLPANRMRKLIRMINTPRWYMTGGVAALVLGAYLAIAGFGLW